MKNKTLFHNRQLITLVSLSLVIGISTLLTHIPPSQSKSCSAFPVVGGEKNEIEVTKTVSQPSVPIPIRGPFGANLNNNWNTDFAIVPLKQYQMYIIKFIAKSSGEYKIRGYLKYNDNTSQEIYNKQSSFQEGQVLEIKGQPKGDNIPFQVNVFVGDPVSFGRTYTISVQGCL